MLAPLTPRTRPPQRAANSAKWSAPAGSSPAGAVVFSRKNSARRPVSRILSCAVIPLGAASPRTLISDLPGGFGESFEPPERVGPMRSAAWLWRALPSLFGLAPCGVYLAPGVTAGAVRSYRTISPLPRRWSFRNDKRTRQAGPTRVLRFQGCPPERGVAEAVSFLWHWPSMGFEAHVPDVIRHTALRSSDFPPPANRTCARPPAATARSSCQTLVYRSPGLPIAIRDFGRKNLDPLRISRRSNLVA